MNPANTHVKNSPLQHFSRKIPLKIPFICNNEEELQCEATSVYVSVRLSAWICVCPLRYNGFHFAMEPWAELDCGLCRSPTKICSSLTPYWNLATQFLKTGRFTGCILTLILLTWKIWWTPINVSKWQIGFNSAFKGLTVTNILPWCRFV